MKKINILYIIDYLHEKGGTERHLTYLLKMLDKKVFCCHVLAFDTGKTELTDEIKKMGVKLIYLPVKKYYTFNALLKAVELYKIIKKEKIDIVQTFHFKSDFYGTIIAKIAGVKHIISSKRDTGDLIRKHHFLLKRLVNGIPRNYIVVSDAVGRIIQKKEKIKNDKIITIYNGVDYNKYIPKNSFEKTIAKEKIGFTDETFVIGTIAWFRPEKNHYAIIKAFKSINNGKMKLILVGGGPLLNYYKKMVKELNISEHVLFTGPIVEIKKYLEIFDIGCFTPSKNEGFSNSVIEKMSMGIPLIVSDVGGNSEAVMNGYNGYVIKPNDDDLLANLIIKLYKNKELRNQMGENARKTVVQKFSLEKMIMEHEELYKKYYR